jgi:hypothetical protein
LLIKKRFGDCKESDHASTRASVRVTRGAWP